MPLSLHDKHVFTFSKVLSERHSRKQDTDIHINVIGRIYRIEFTLHSQKPGGLYGTLTLSFLLRKFLR